METIELEFFRVFNIEPDVLLKYEIGEDVFEIIDKKIYAEDTYDKIAIRSPINGKCVSYIGEDEVYPAITAEIREKLEEIILNCDYSLTKVPNHSYELDDLYCWFDTTTLNRKNVTGKNRKEATEKICIQLQSEIQEQVKELFQ